MLAKILYFVQRDDHEGGGPPVGGGGGGCGGGGGRRQELPQEAQRDGEEREAYYVLANLTNS